MIHYTYAFRVSDSELWHYTPCGVFGEVKHEAPPSKVVTEVPEEVTCSECRIYIKNKVLNRLISFP